MDLERGRLIEKHNPQPHIRRNAENTDWEYAEEANYLYTKAIQLRDRLIDPIARIDRGQLPDPIIGFKDLRNHKVLAEYLLVKDELGLTSRINFNTQQYEDKDGKKVFKYGRWSQLEVLTHEYVHLKHQVLGIRAGHGKPFCTDMEKMGLHPLPNVGCHVAVATEPFSIVMKDWGIERPEDVPTDIVLKTDYFRHKNKPQGRSTLTLWVCECDPPQRARIGTGEFHATCDICDMPFRRKE